MTIKIEADAIKALHKFPSTDPARTDLAGIRLEAGGRVIASNGHIAGVFREGHDGDLDMTIPTRDSREVRNVLKRVAMKSNKDPAIVTEVESGVYRIEGNGAVAEFIPIADRFRDIDNVFPPESSGKGVDRISLNSSYLALFPQGLQGRVRLKFHGEMRAIEVTCDDPRFTGLLMPMEDLE